MNVGIVGLGLIGGSIAKAIKQNTDHIVFGKDILETVVLKAKLLSAIDEELTDQTLEQCELVIIALYPGDTVKFIEENAAKFKKGALVVDCCGVKRVICAAAQPLAEQNGFTFVGGHPMAGIEKSGFEYSMESLFKNASMILTPDGSVDIQEIDFLKQLFLSLGFGGVKLSTPEEHDRIIAYTSQLAHVLSSAYIKSESALTHMGFSAGSFKDMTRVATLHEGMWTELFLDNKEGLTMELDGLIARLSEYRKAIAGNDAPELMRLLKEGRERKALVDNSEAGR